MHNNLPPLNNETPPLVLLVDDIMENIQVLHHMLAPEKYAFAIATSARETFVVLEKKNPDLILLDIMLDDLDGFEICRRLKADQHAAHIPVIFLTARDHPEDKVKGFALGAVDYITKPFDENEVIARVRTHLKLKRSNDLIKDYLRQLQAVNQALESKNLQILEQKNQLENTLSELQDSYQKYKLSQEKNLELEKQNALMTMAITTNHELNQPLTVILGYFELLRQSFPTGALSSTQLKYLEKIQAAFGRMVEVMERFRKSPLAQINDSSIFPAPLPNNFRPDPS